MIHTDIDTLRTFLNSARRGGQTAASTGERAAFHLAKRAAELSRLMQDLDSANQEAYARLLIALAWPDTRATLLRLLPP